MCPVLVCSDCSDKNINWVAYKQQTFISTVQDAGRSTSRGLRMQRIRDPGEPSLRRLSSDRCNLRSHEISLCSLFTQAPISLMRFLPFRPHHFPKVPPPNAITLRGRISTHKSSRCGRVENKHSDLSTLAASKNLT